MKSNPELPLPPKDKPGEYTIAEELAIHKREYILNLPKVPNCFVSPCAWRFNGTHLYIDIYNMINHEFVTIAYNETPGLYVGVQSFFILYVTNVCTVKYLYNIYYLLRNGVLTEAHLDEMMKTLMKSKFMTSEMKLKMMYTFDTRKICFSYVPKRTQYLLENVHAIGSAVMDGKKVFNTLHGIFKTPDKTFDEKDIRSRNNCLLATKVSLLIVLHGLRTVLYTEEQKHHNLCTFSFDQLYKELIYCITQ